MMEEIIEIIFFGNRVLDYLICTGLFLGGFVIIKIFQHIILKNLKKWAEKTVTTLDDFLVGVIQKIALPLAYFGVLYLSVNTLTMDPLFKKIIDIAMMAIITIFAARLA